MTATNNTFNLCPKCGSPMRVRRTTNDRMHIERLKFCAKCVDVNFQTMEIHVRRHDRLLRAEAADIAALNQQPQAQVEAPTPEPVLPSQVIPTPAHGWDSTKMTDQELADFVNGKHLVQVEQAEMDRLNAARDFVQQSVAENESEEGKPVDLDDEYQMTDEEAALYQR